MATTYYYVGAGTSGSPTGWNSSALWSLSSGGSGGAGIPGSADTAIFDANSGYCTLDVAMNITTLTLNTGFANTLSFGSYGSTVSGTVTHAQGTLNTSSQTCSWGTYTNNSSTATRTITMGSSAISLSVTWSNSTSTGLTITANTAVITFTGASPTVQTGTISMNGASWIINSTGAITISNQTTVANLTVAPSSSSSTQFQLNTSITVSTALTFTGLTAPYLFLVQSTALGTARTITCNGTVTINNRVDFQDIAGAGTASWNLSASLVGNRLGNSGITFPTATNLYWYATASANYSVAGNWYLATGGTGGAGRVPLPQDTAYCDANSGGHTLTLDTGAIGSVNQTGFTGTTVNGTGTCYYFGNWACGGTYTSTSNVLVYYGRGSNTWTTNGASFQFALTINGIGGTVTLQDNFNQTLQTLSFSAGTFNANNFNVNYRSFIINGTNNKTLNGPPLL